MPELGSHRSPEVAEGTTLLVPLGSTEQHGPHLPLDTDTRIAAAVARAAAADRDDVLVAPALPYGASGEHAGFAGTLSIGTEALHLVLVELVRSHGPEFTRTVFVNGHGGNVEGVRSAVAQLRDEGHDVTAWSPRVRGGDAHAGETETSLLLAIAPEVVRPDLAEPGDQRPLAEVMAELRRGGVRAVSDNGVLGDPTDASVEAGRATLAALVADLVALLDGEEIDT
ncbi:MAG: mycofactocin biosynthesis peptidyl-dipeptidase MftE [Actinomycetota bacterium]